MVNAKTGVEALVAPTAQSAVQSIPSVLRPELATAIFDQEALRIVSVSGAEFLARWNVGEFREVPDTPQVRELSYLILLIPFGRQLSG